MEGAQPLHPLHSPKIKILNILNYRLDCYVLFFIPLINRIDIYKKTI